MKKVTLEALRDRARSLGYSARKVEGEYRVAPRLDTTRQKFPLKDRLAHIEEQAYYTTDIDDAYDTLIKMATRRNDIIENQS